MKLQAFRKALKIYRVESRWATAFVVATSINEAITKARLAWTRELGRTNRGDLAITEVRCISNEVVL